MGKKLKERRLSLLNLRNGVYGVHPRVRWRGVLNLLSVENESVLRVRG
jgi:hypothetical protein